MRKSLIYMTVLLVLGACQKIDLEDQLLDTVSENGDMKFNVTIDEAKKFASIVGELPNETKQITTTEPIVYGGDTLLYIINYNDKGWVIISGDKRTEPILAIDENGEEMHLNTINRGVFTWLDDIAASIYQLKQDNPLDTNSQGYKIWSGFRYDKANSNQLQLPIDGDPLHRVLISVTSIQLPSYQKGPFVQTKWGQGDPWNLCVPFGEAVNGIHKRCLTGCVAVATAQLLYYGHFKSNKPTWMYSQGSCTGFSWDGFKSYSFSFATQSTTVWNNMPAFWWEAETYNVAILMGYVGWQVDMNYGLNSSGASSDNVPGVFSGLGVACTKQGYDYNKVISNLNSNKPVYSSAYSIRDDHKFLGIHLYYTYDDGHAWIIDGYEDKKYQYTYTYRWEGTGGFNPEVKKSADKVDEDTPYNGMIEVFTTNSSTKYYIMNWGWGGSFDTGRYLPAGAWNPSTYNFQYEKSIICDFSF